MADQLSLFPAKDVPVEEKPVRRVDISALDEMFATCRRYRNSRVFKEMLTFISRFPQYSALNGCLLYIQNPHATDVATAGVWERRFGRKPRPEARPLVILAPMAPVLFLFDLADTEGKDVGPGLLKPPVFRGRLLQEIYDKTVENCSIHGIAVRDAESPDPRIGQTVTLTYHTRKQYRDLAPAPRSNYLIVLDQRQSLEDRYGMLAYGLGHIFCGHLGIDSKAWWKDRRGADQLPADIEAEAVAFLVLRRKGLAGQTEKYLSGYVQRERELPIFSLNAVFHAVQYIEEMGKAVWQFPKKKSRYL